LVEGWLKERVIERERELVREGRERERLDQMDLSGKAKPNYKGRICIPHGTEYGAATPPFSMYTDIKNLA